VTDGVLPEDDLTWKLLRQVLDAIAEQDRKMIDTQTLSTDFCP